MKKIITLITVLYSFILFNNITFGNLEIGTGGVIKNEKIFNGLECIKYNDYVSSINENYSDLFDLLHYNYIEKEKKEKIENEKYEKSNKCKLNYKYNPKKQIYENFTIYNKNKKIESKVYDKIFEDSIVFDDNTNECSFSAKKDGKSIFILNGKEIGEFKSIYTMIKNITDGKLKIAFSTELENGNIVIYENGKKLYFVDKGKYKKGSLKYTNLGQITYVVKDIFSGKEYLFIDGKEKKEYSGYSVYFGDKNSKIDFLILEKNSNRYLLSGAEYYINGNKVKYNFYHISNIDYLSNGKIIYSGRSINGDNLSYIVIDGKLSKGYNEFLNVAIKKDGTNLYGDLYPYFESENGDIYFIAIKENKKYVLIKNGIELFEYKNEPEIYSESDKHFVYNVKLENGKYSVVIDGKKSLIEFENKPILNNQRFLELSKYGFFILDFRYNNYNYICNFTNYKSSKIFKEFKLKKYISDKFTKSLNLRYDKLIGKYTTKEIFDIQKKDLIRIKNKLKVIKKEKTKYKKLIIITIVEELIDSYLVNIERQDKSSLNINKKFTLSKWQNESGFFDKKSFKLKNNYTYNDLFTNKKLFFYIHGIFNYTSDENITYFKKVIYKYVTSKGYKLSKDYKIGKSYQNGKIFIIESKYISNLSKDKRLEISFGK